METEEARDRSKALAKDTADRLWKNVRIEMDKRGIRFWKQLARKCNLPKNEVSAWHTGRKPTGPTVLPRLCAGLGVTEEYLLRQDPEPVAVSTGNGGPVERALQECQEEKAKLQLQVDILLKEIQRLKIRKVS